MRKPNYCNKEDMNKGAWSKQEDQKLINYIRNHGEGCWRALPQAAGLHRCGKSCRLRWINYLRPDIKRGNFGEDEEDLIIRLHALLGNRWSLIAGRLPGRTDNEVKNYWNTHLRRKLINKGIDPNNHRLNHHCHRRHQNFDATGSATTCARQVRSQGDNDHISDGGSCLDDENGHVPDLNLDLTITIPSSSFSVSVAKEEIKHNESTVLREMDCASSPTLLLFM